MEEEEDLSELEVEQAPPVVPVPAPVEPPVKRKRGRPPKNKPESEYPEPPGRSHHMSAACQTLT